MSICIDKCSGKILVPKGQKAWVAAKNSGN